MQLRHFIYLTAVILCGWLAVTFVTDVPTTVRIRTGETDEAAI